jgi:DNA-binding NtrC family response regulator
VIERMVIAADGETIGPEHLPVEIRNEASLRIAGVESATMVSGRGGSFLERKAEAERQIVLAALDRNDGHVTRAAQELGLADHASLLKIMRRLAVSY